MDEKELKKAAHEYLSKKAKSRWADPAYRAKQMAARKKLWEDPEFLERHRQGQIKRGQKRIRKGERK